MYDNKGLIEDNIKLKVNNVITAKQHSNYKDNAITAKQHLNVKDNVITAKQYPNFKVNIITVKQHTIKTIEYAIK